MAELAGEYISSREAVKLFGVSDSQLRRLLISGKVQGVKLARNWLVFRPSLTAYMADRPRPGLRPGQKINRPSKRALPA
jgi:hypothetical protein